MSTIEHAADTHAIATAPGTASGDAATELRTLGFGEPLRWLVRGAHDYVSHPAISLFYGICFMAMGWAVLKVYEHAPAYTLVMSAALLLTGPLLCMGLYQMSMRLEQGVQEPDFGDSLTAWDEHIAQLAIFGFVLLVLEMLWGRSVMIIFAVSFDGMPDLKGSLLALLDPENIGFIITYLCVSTMFGLLIFAISAVSIPMMLDRQVDAITAGLTSMKLVLTQPGVMLFWGALIVVLMVAAMLPWFLGLLFVGPVVGHASWHAYRATVVWIDAPVATPADPS
jgi:uncharacterized membrane protein